MSFETQARTILSQTSGFIAQAGFTHSLTPARNCTYGCTYCYVPTLQVFGGLKRADWERWGQFTTFKSNAAELLAQELRPDRIIYCSPLVDPYQPAEAERLLMPGILKTLIERPPKVFVVQTRSPLILRDLPLLRRLSARTALRVSFSITTDDESIRKLYEPQCDSFEQRLETIRILTAEGIATHATLAPLLPCNPEQLAERALSVTTRDLIGDPLHVRSTKRRGATTRSAAFTIAAHHNHQDWFTPSFQDQVVARISSVAARTGRRFATGPEAFSWLTQMEDKRRKPNFFV